MSEQLLKKLQFKNQPKVLIVESPPEFNTVLSYWKKLAAIDTDMDMKKKYPLALGFVKSETEVKKVGAAISKQLEDDAVFWMAYPKKSSEKYAVTITRDNGWNHLGVLGFEGVALVSIDEDWSALRFRKADHISSMIRRQDMAMSEKGKRKTVNKTNKAIKSGKA